MRNHKMMTPKFVRDLLALFASMGGGKQIIRTHQKIGRNERCRCSSGMKYKWCCWPGDVKRGIR